MHFWLCIPGRKYRSLLSESPHAGSTEYCHLESKAEFLHLTVRIVFFIFRSLFRKDRNTPPTCSPFQNYLFMFCCITFSTATGFLLMQSKKCCSLPDRRNQEHFRRDLFMRAGRVWTFLLPDINSMIRFKSLDLLRPTSNKTPLCQSITWSTGTSKNVCCLTRSPEWCNLPLNSCLFITIEDYLQIYWEATCLHICMRCRTSFC